MLENKVLSFRMVLIITPSRPQRNELKYRQFINESKLLSHTKFGVQKVPIIESVPLDEVGKAAVTSFTTSIHKIYSWFFEKS